MILVNRKKKEERRKKKRCLRPPHPLPPSPGLSVREPLLPTAPGGLPQAALSLQGALPACFSPRAGDAATAPRAHSSTSSSRAPHSRAPPGPPLHALPLPISSSISNSKAKAKAKGLLPRDKLPVLAAAPLCASSSCKAPAYVETSAGSRTGRRARHPLPPRSTAQQPLLLLRRR